MGFYEIPEVYNTDLKQFEEDIKEYKAGNIDEVKFRAIRVAFGCYEQRREGTYMVRVRCPGGLISPQQLLIAAELSEKYGSDELHITTRQEFQIHYVKLDSLLTIIHQLKAVGLSSRGGGGNTVRNVTASYDAGVNPEEVFDVTPYCLALTERLIAEPDSWNLPRKYKIAFSGNAKDTSLATVTDLGFIARMLDGKKGFRVYIAGGMGKKSQPGNLLYDFMPEEEVYYLAAAVKKMFDKHGNRRKKYASRLRFLWNKLGREEFVQYLEEEKAALMASGEKPLTLKELKNAENADINIVSETVESPEFDLWKKRYLHQQKQEGLLQIHVPILHGNITYQAAQRLAYFLTNIGENTLRLTMQQNMYLRNIPKEYLGNVFDVVREMTPIAKKEAFYGSLVSCIGAQACKLGLCLSRNLSSAIMEKLEEEKINLDEIPGMRTYISGCPNACGQHPLSNFGFYGRAARQAGSIYPSYRIVGGAVIEDGKTKLAEDIAEINARSLPEFMARFFKIYIAESDKFGDFNAYLEGPGRHVIKELAEEYAVIPNKSEDESYYIDWGANAPLSLDDIGTDECSAGLFDMIDVDEKKIKKLLKALPDLDGKELHDALQEMTFLSSRMLLITRGIDTNDAAESYDGFLENFMKEGIVSEDFKDIVLMAKANDATGLSANKEQVVSLAKTMLALYDDMDDSLRFSFGTSKKTVAAEPVQEEVKANYFKDYRGVRCPINFVKTKLVLDMMQSGETLEILLDDGEPISNVPRSVLNEGHKIHKTEQIEGHWSVLIEKA